MLYLELALVESHHPQRPARHVGTCHRVVTPGAAPGVGNGKRLTPALALASDPGGSSPRCRSASPWSACCPAPSRARRSACGSPRAGERGLRSVSPTWASAWWWRDHLFLADHGRAGAQADRAARPRRVACTVAPAMMLLARIAAPCVWLLDARAAGAAAARHRGEPDAGHRGGDPHASSPRPRPPASSSPGNAR